MDVLASRVRFGFVLGEDAEGVSAEVVPLSLQQACGEVGSSVPVKEGQGSRERRRGDAPQRGLCYDPAPPGLRLMDRLVEEVVEQQVLKVWLSPEGFSDLSEKAKSASVSVDTTFGLLINKSQVTHFA
jgi:hypothetical protein